MNSEAQEQKSSLRDQIVSAQNKIKELEGSLRKHETELASLNIDSEKYTLLDEITERLGRLNKLGSSSMVWGDNVSEEQAAEKVEEFQTQVDRFDKKVNAIELKIAQLRQNVRDYNEHIAILTDDILIIDEEEEERKNEYIIEREVTALPYREMVMPWAVRGEDENRFRKIMLLVLLFTVLLGYLVPLWDIPEPDKDEVVEIPERLAKLIIKKKKPKKEVVQPRQQKEDQPKKKVAKAARKKAEKSGLLAFKNNFADLMDDDIEKNLGSNARLSNKGATLKSNRTLISSAAGKRSGGINTSNLDRNVKGSGTSLSGVQFSRVDSSIGDIGGEARPLSDAPGPSRTDEEIQIVFDRYKAALYRIYNRQLRVNPTLQGKMVLLITIKPNGKVSKCKVESSDMDSPELSKKIAGRVLLFNFGAKKGVSTITIRYPIDFLPAT